mmetsp:Transcript_28358/g.69948  ORF Transcript_28358/g.69948 Transcript_28358/m.69948 type:complete len:154 (-) Transcript_28358:184-645(-)
MGACQRPPVDLSHVPRCSSWRPVGTRQRLQPITRATLHAPMGASGTLSPAPLLHGVGMDVLQWARANGCPRGEGTIRAAVRGGHLDVLQWACANGCPPGPLTIAGARALMAAKRLEDEEYLYVEKFFCCKFELTEERQERVKAVAEWLRANGF